jgi:general secretion pathway protein E
MAKANKKAISLEGRDDAREAMKRRALGSNPRKSTSIASGSLSVASQLVKSNLLEPEQARAAAFEARARGISVAHALSEAGAVPREKIVDAIEMTNVALLASGLDFDVRLPKRVLRENRICIHAQTDRKLMLSTTSNLNVVKQLLGPYVGNREIVEVPFNFAKWAEFEQGIDKIMEPDHNDRVEDTDLDPRSVVPEQTDDAEVLDLLVDYAAVMNTSDIHIEPQKLTYNVFFRYLGKRKLVHCGTIDQYSRVCAMVKDRARVDPMETRIPQDGSFSTQVRGRPYDVRVATVPSDGREKITMRLLDPIRAQMRLQQLGITQVDDWRRIVEYRNGIVLIVGATGSGKTTTLNATVREMKRFEKCIYTAEDPVEYRIPYVTHVQMNEAVGLDFARSIKAFMRGDPDVIILGEIRDDITASKAIQAAETGHLVIATIHAESVPMAIQRLRGLNVKLEDFEMLLRGILVQFLMRTLCTECRGAGCEECFGEGYAGRTVVSEIARVMKPVDVQRMINSEKKPEDKYWTPLWKDIENKITTNVTDGREVYRTFASELEEMSIHSPILAQILAEERAKRDHVSSAVAAAQVEEMAPADKAKQRQIAQARLQAASVPEEVAEMDAMSRDGEPLGISRLLTGDSDGA